MDIGSEHKKSFKAIKIIGAVVGDSALIFAVTALSAVLFVMLVMYTLTHGPSEQAKYIFVNSCNETSALKFLPHWFLSDEEVFRLLSPTAEDGFDYLDFKKDTAVAEIENEEAAATDPSIISEDDGFVDGIKIEDVGGETFRGKAMLVKDPERVTIGVLSSYGGGGKFLYSFIEDYGAIAGINGGGFADEEGKGNGGCPDGVVIKDGKILFGTPGEVYNNVIGFDADHNLINGSFSPAGALASGIVEGFSFTMGNVLIKDGVEAVRLGGGYNPRAAIGQTEDGTIILLVIEGRTAASLGTTRDDLVKIMSEYGAVNASMLDGGSSAEMRYNGEQLTRGSGLIGMRGLPDAILVMPEVNK
ncbi:MAG: phosphodiester glycosidase family protein [Lachnospiraceae bacterium]|nr:phosphodiester glycosidase family protein [Lachnospiraceae bacterium]